MTGHCARLAADDFAIFVVDSSFDLGVVAGSRRRTCVGDRGSDGAIAVSNVAPRQDQQPLRS